MLENNLELERLSSKFEKTDLSWNEWMNSSSLFKPEEILVTSSFGSTSSVLLHLLSKTEPDHPVYIVNTGYLFDETLRYKEQVKERLGLNVISVGPKNNKHDFNTRK